MKLSPAQRVALLALAASERNYPESWSKPWGTREPTLVKLRDLGLVRLNIGYSVTIAQITEAGMAAARELA